MLKLAIDDVALQMRTDESSGRGGNVWRRTLERLERKYGVHRIVKFGIASGVGFLVAELILALGVVATYRTVEVPSISYSSASIILLDALALGTGGTVAFIINERVTVKRRSGGPPKETNSPIFRWGRYQLSSLLGNLVIVLVQLALLASISLTPILGNIVGAIVSYPMTYAVSMRLVWRTHPFRGDDLPATRPNRRV